MRRFYDLMVAHTDELAALLTAEQGKPLAEARGELGYAADFLEWFADEAPRVYGDTIPGLSPANRVMVLKQPIGVAAAITPWNFPSAMITRKLGAALAAGCSMVLKPSELTPFSALALGALSQEAGLPDGLFNIVTGDAAEIGSEFTANPAVRKLSFTGSTRVGSLLMAQSAPTVKKLGLELGGNAPFIVFDDADIDAAVAGAIAAKFRNAGQTCVSANRFYVQAGVHDAFVAKFTAAVEALKVGPGTEAGVNVGPLIDERAVAKVAGFIEDAVSRGAKVVTGGARHALGGRFFQPTILTGVSREMKVSCEEIFGPVAPILKFTTEAEALALANDTEFGLAAYFYARDLGRVWRVAEALESGMVGINAGGVSNAAAPFGGIKSSGLGREGSMYGVEDYLEVKYLNIGL
jgi:succinate-semialdehyde dehydrogenase/glutarate-semialdehyde dehydrogenase